MPVPGELTFAAPRRAKPPRHLADLTPAERRSAVTVLSDIGGYVAGVLFGRHPMAPTISPKKSWEGFAGSALFTAVGGAVILPVLLEGEI